jgi:hypothetical protein
MTTTIAVAIFVNAVYDVADSISTCDCLHSKLDLSSLALKTFYIKDAPFTLRRCCWC